MRQKFTLDELGKRLAMVDAHIVALLAQRMQLGKEVERTKRENRDQLLRFVVEEKRLAAARDRADEEGIDHNFVHALFYLIIAETCRVQINQLQTKPILDDLCSEKLKENLLALTEEIAPSYDQYGQGFFATESYLEFEKKILGREIETLKGLNNTSQALDLGCATGRVTFKLAKNFKRVIGFDISPAMIEQAEARSKEVEGKFSNVEFKLADIEEGIPLSDNSVSFVAMNLGTASDILNIRRVLASIRRVLKPDGRFVLSFYNAGSLLYSCWFLPWAVSLAARINFTEHCLETRFNGKVFSIPGRPYTVREVRKLLNQSRLSISEIMTYPTVSSILPKEFFEEANMRALVERVDHRLIALDMGAYILVTGRKIN